MTRAKEQIQREINVLQKRYDKEMNRYYKSAWGKSWEDGLIYEEADKIGKKKRLLEDAITLIERYEESED